MSFFADLYRRVQLSSLDAEVIFDRDEPVGRPTDLVMPRRRWFRRQKGGADPVRRGMASDRQMKPAG
jgi:hypothetical protein